MAPGNYHVTHSTTVSLLEDAQYWHDRAEEIRILAEDMHQVEPRRVMLSIAESYDELARWAEEKNVAHDV
jgi:hypothetical protein